jgi:hypothetical protein
MSPKAPDSPPAIQLAGLKVWVHGYESPGATDVWDGNWLTVTAHCEASGASVWVSGSILDAVGIAAWHHGLQTMYDTLQGEAVLECPEPDLRVRVVFVDHVGHIEITVEITPDYGHQRHKFVFDADQTYLPLVIEQCRVLLASHPVRDERS